MDLPLGGAPAQVIESAVAPHQVALLADDAPDLRARLCVREGEVVARGQLLFEDRGAPGGRYTAPAAGVVQAIHRGARRALQSLVIRLDEAELRGGDAAAQVRFAARADGGEASSAAEVRALLVESGLWTALRARPFGKVPPPDAAPHALFVTAIDTQPLAPRPEVVVAERRRDFERGLRLVAKLCAGKTYLCVGADSPLAESVDAPVSVERFAGPHPAGCAGVHIHRLAPVGRRRSVWSIGYQDVIAAGRLFDGGRLDVERVVALGGPPVRRPRLLRTRLGAALADLCAGELSDPAARVISGSPLSGRAAMGPLSGFLGRYDVQISAVREAAGDGAASFSLLPRLRSLWTRPRTYDLTTRAHGARRPLVPIGLYERVVPLDILPTLLLRALLAGDDEQAEELGCLELLEEDLALCSFVCPGKNDYAGALRAALRRLEQEA